MTNDRKRTCKPECKPGPSYFATREEAEFAPNIAFEFVEGMQKLLKES